MNCLLKNAIDFIGVLRLAGVRVSVAESMDAVNSMKFIDLQDKNQVRIALSACLAKSGDERRIFQEAFDRYFIAPEDRVAHIHAKMEEHNNKRREILEEASQLKFQDESLRLEEEWKEVYSSLSDQEKQSIKDFLKKTSTGKNVRHGFRPVVERVIASKLKGMREKVTQGITQNAAYPVFSEAGIIAGEVLEFRKNENDLLHCRIDQIRDEQMPTVIGLILKMTNQLRKNAMSRYRHSKQASSLDFKKTLQSSHMSGGVPFRLIYKKRAKRKNKYLLLCDVSASMYRFSGFVQQFIRGMNLNVSNMDSYIFSDDIDHLDMKYHPNTSSFEQQILHSKVWRRGTNIFNAFRQIFQSRHIILNSSTIILVISDAKTLDADKSAEYLKQIAGKVKRVLWFNPIPQQEWVNIKGTDKFRSYAKMLDCSTLSKLAEACASIDY